MDLFGDIGGIIDIFIALFGLVLFKVSEASFYLSAIEKLYKLSDAGVEEEVSISACNKFLITVNVQ